MRDAIRSFILACGASSIFPAGASANTSVPMSPVTKSLPGLPCPVTATFTQSACKRQMSYGSGASSASGPGATTIDVVLHVYNVVNDKSLRLNISLLGLQGRTPINPAIHRDHDVCADPHLPAPRVSASDLPDRRSS